MRVEKQYVMVWLGGRRLAVWLRVRVMVRVKKGEWERWWDWICVRENEKGSWESDDKGQEVLLGKMKATSFAILFSAFNWKRVMLFSKLPYDCHTTMIMCHTTTVIQALFRHFSEKRPINFWHFQLKCRQLDSVLKMPFLLYFEAKGGKSTSPRIRFETLTSISCCLNLTFC